MKDVTRLFVRDEFSDQCRIDLFKQKFYWTLSSFYSYNFFISNDKYFDN